MVSTGGDNLCAIITNKGPLLEIDQDRNNKELYNFKMVADLEKDRAPFDFVAYSNLNANTILKK